MHCVAVSLGLRFDRLNRALPESSSDNATVPAAAVLPGLVVVAVNAAFVADSTSAPLTATATRATSPFCRRRSHRTTPLRARVRRATPRRPTTHHLSRQTSLLPSAETSPV